MNTCRIQRKLNFHWGIRCLSKVRFKLLIVHLPKIINKPPPTLTQTTNSKSKDSNFSNNSSSNNLPHDNQLISRRKLQYKISTIFPRIIKILNNSFHKKYILLPRRTSQGQSLLIYSSSNSSNLVKKWKINNWRLGFRRWGWIRRKSGVYRSRRSRRLLIFIRNMLKSFVYPIIINQIPQPTPTI